MSSSDTETHESFTHQLFGRFRELHERVHLNAVTTPAVATVAAAAGIDQDAAMKKEVLSWWAGGLPLPHEEMTIGIVGGGVAGLAIARVLKKATGGKANVTIFEATDHVGGRLDTYYYPGTKNHGELGGMRIPGLGPKHSKHLGPHYMTDQAVKDYDIATIPFKNEDKNILHYIRKFDGTSYTCTDRHTHTAQFAKDLEMLYPGWRSGIPEKLPAGSPVIATPNDYFGATLQPVVMELEKSGDWASWVAKWSSISVLQYLRADPAGVQVDDPEQRWPAWSEMAIKAFSEFWTFPLLTIDVAEILRDTLGQWWKDPMYTMRKGMSALPIAMAAEAERNGCHLHLNARVTGIAHSAGGAQINYNLDGVAQPALVFDYVFCTLAFHALRDVEFLPPLSPTKREGILHVENVPAAKILINCTKPFWAEPPLNIHGGLSTTNLPLGQLRYPTTEFKHGKPVAENETPVFVCYAWMEAAEQLNLMSKEDIFKMVEEVHPQIKDYASPESVYPWCWTYDKTGFHGGFVLFRQGEYNRYFEEMCAPTDDYTVHFAGEAYSWANGWTQGALVSAMVTLAKFTQSYTPRCARSGGVPAAVAAAVNPEEVAEVAEKRKATDSGREARSAKRSRN